MWKNLLTVALVLLLFIDIGLRLEGRGSVATATAPSKPTTGLADAGLPPDKVAAIIGSVGHPVGADVPGEAPSGAIGIDATEIDPAARLIETALAIPLPDPALALSPVIRPGARLYVAGSSVNLRSGPSAQSARITALAQGTAVSFLEAKGGWLHIEVVDRPDLTGWMSAQFLTETVPVALTPAPEPPPRERSVAPPTSAEIRAATKEIISQSIASYPGSCACPYQYDRAGRRCGKRSAWSKPGGYSPICYDSDISEARLASYFARKRGASE